MGRWYDNMYPFSGSRVNTNLEILAVRDGNQFRTGKPRISETHFAIHCGCQHVQHMAMTSQSWYYILSTRASESIQGMNDSPLDSPLGCLQWALELMIRMMMIRLLLQSSFSIKIAFNTISFRIDVGLHKTMKGDEYAPICAFAIN